MRVVIQGRLPSLNQYINVERANRFGAASMKRRVMNDIGWQVKTMVPITEPSHYTFNWYVKDARTDPDNIAFAVKFILDALQEQGKLAKDNFKNVLSINHTFNVDKDERVEILVE